MPTIDELLGPAPSVGRPQSIADILGPEPSPRSYFPRSDQLVDQPERPDTPADFLDERTAWKGPRGFQSAEPTRREELEAQRDAVVDTPSGEKLTAQAAVGGRYGAMSGFKQTLAGVLRSVNAPPILTWLWSKSAEQDAADAEKYGEMIGGGKSGRLAQEFGSTAIQSLPALAAAPAGILGIAVTAGAQTFGSVTEDAFQAYQAKGDPDALNKARLAGGLAGVVTAGLTRYMPGGTERFAAALARGELSQVAAQGVIKTILKEAAKEFPEEALDQVSQGVIAKFSYRPETTWENIADDSLKAGLMGGALAGFTGTAVLPAVRATSRLRGRSSLRESISTDEPQMLETPIERTVQDASAIQTPVEIPRLETPGVAAQVAARESSPVQVAAEPTPPQVQAAPIISPEPAAVESSTAVAAQVGKPEAITAAAIKLPDGTVRTGAIHALIEGSMDTGAERGFVTDKGRFVSENESASMDRKTIQMKVRGDIAADEIQDPFRRETYLEEEIKSASGSEREQLQKQLSDTRSEIESMGFIRSGDRYTKSVPTTAPESRTTAATMTPEAIRAELDSVTKQIAERPKAKTIEELDAQAPLNNRANFLREALKIQEEVAPTAKTAEVSSKEPSETAKPTEEATTIRDSLMLGLTRTPAVKSLIRDIESGISYVADLSPEKARSELASAKVNWDSQLSTLKQIEAGKAEPKGRDYDDWQFEQGKLGRVLPFETWAAEYAVPRAEDMLRQIEQTKTAISKLEKLKAKRNRVEPEPTAVEEPLAPKSPSEILSTAKKVKVKASEGATQIRVTDKSGKVAVQPLASVNKANPFIGVDVAKVEAGTIDKGGKFKPIAGDVTVTDVEAVKKAKTFADAANEIAANLEGIKSGRRAGDLQAFGIIPAVWDAAISIAQGIIRAGGTVADAVKAAIDHIRANNNAPFDEAGAAAFIDRAVQPETAYAEPQPDEAEPANDAGMVVNIAGRQYDVISKDRLTPEQRAEGDTAAQATFRALGIPGVPDATVDRRAGSIDNNTVWKVVPDGQLHDAQSAELRDHLVAEIQKQNTRDGDPAYVSSLINAINMNFDLGNWRGVISQSALESLLNVSVGESSRRGTMLRQLRGISEDIRAIAQNAALRLKWVYAEAFDPDGVGRETLQKVKEYLEPAVATGAVPDQAAREDALRRALESLTPKKRSKVAKGTPLGKKIEQLVKAGGLDDTELFRAFAKEHRWKVPTDKEIEQMREWANREQQLQSPSPEEVAKFGGNAEAARTATESATIDARKELLRKMNTQWSQWTQPLVTNWRDLGNAEKVKNTNMAFNEWVAANLLLKLGFGTRQVIDVGTQMALNTPTRALAYAWENWRINPDDSSLQHSIAEAFSDAYRTRLKVLGYALNSFKQTIKGKGEQRQVEQLISSIGIFDRALMNAERMRAEGKRGAANLLEVIAIGMRMGRQFAAAMDIVHGIPAESQEIAHQVRNGLKLKGLSGEALNLQFDSIMGILVAQRAEALTTAREILELRGQDTSSSAVERAAWHILREKIYHAAQQAGMPADEWKKQNKLFRDLIGWNESETGGLKAPGGPGGLVALGGRAAKEMLSKVPLVGGVMSVPFTFTNAMGISMNRKLAWSPLGFFPGIFKGSPHWEGEANIRQRKVEAAIGTGLSTMIFSLIIAGVWKALPAFWPKDEKERDKWVRNGWSPGMVIVPWNNGKEVHISTRTGPLAFFAPTIAAAAAYTSKQEERAKKQLAINERAKKLGLAPEQLEGLSATDWMGIMFGAGYSSLSGGRTASGALAAYTDFGNFNVKKASASVATAIAPGFPALNEFGRLAGANINPKLASFWDLMVPMPTSNAQRVNMLGDPMKDENDYRRVFTILSGGNFPFPTAPTPAETQAYAALFATDYRPPAINPMRSYQVGNKLRPMTADELQRYTVARGVEFKQALSTLGSNPTEEAVKAAFVDANQRALSSVGVTIPKPSRVLARTPTRYRSRLRGGRTRRIRGFGRGRLRSRIGIRRRRKLGVLR